MSLEVALVIWVLLATPLFILNATRVGRRPLGLLNLTIGQGATFLTMLAAFCVGVFVVHWF